MIKQELYEVNIYDKKEGEIINTRHTFDLQEARRWKRESAFGEIINKVGREIK